MKVLVTTYRTAGDRIALAALRGLARDGHEAWLGSDDTATAAFASRHHHGALQLPSPIAEPSAHAMSIRAHVTSADFATVMPTDDYAVYALAKSQAETEWPVSLPVPDIAAYRLSQDKAAATDRAASLGLTTPMSRRVDTAEGLRAALDELAPPWVVKLGRGNGGVGLMISGDRSEILERFEGRPDYADDVFDFHRLLVQTFIPGETHDVGLLYNKGEPRAAVTSRRLLTYPVTGGGGILTETTDRPDLLERAMVLLNEIGWHGPAAVEFRIDSRDGTPNFIEINGRLWGTLALAQRVGTDFATLACRIAVDGDVPPRFEHPVGLRHRWPLPNGSRHAAESRNPLRALWALFGPAVGTSSSIWLSDLGPTLVDLRTLFGSKGARVRSLSPLDIDWDRRSDDLDAAGQSR